MDKVGPQPVIDLVKKTGVTSYLPKVPSIALGTPDISLFELVGAYGTFANQGIYIEPIVITRIEDKNGMALFEVVPNTRDVISQEAAYVTVDLIMLQDTHMDLTTQLQEKQERLKTKVMGGLWAWCRIW